MEFKSVFESEIKAVDTENLILEHFISTEKRDRGGDILYADGMRVDGKPVVLWAHGRDPKIGPEPIAKPLFIRPSSFKGTKGIEARTQFFPDETGKRLFNKAAAGVIPNWSIGWIPHRHDFKTGKDGKEERHVYDWSLLEYSLCAVPSQPDAQTVYGKGIDENVMLFKVIPEGDPYPIGKYLPPDVIKEMEREGIVCCARALGPDGYWGFYDARDGSITLNTGIDRVAVAEKLSKRYGRTVEPEAAFIAVLFHEMGHKKIPALHRLAMENPGLRPDLEEWADGYGANLFLEWKLWNFAQLEFQKWKAARR